MGAYLSEPVTEKHSSEIYNDSLSCAASCMQGWRISQEDAHNLILDYDKETSLFAVYDGHGGPEVALYCAEKLPEFIRSTKAYALGDIDKALKDAFLEFDATIAETHVVEILKRLSSNDDTDKEDMSEEDVESLCQEAKMPLEKLIARYKSDYKRIKNEVGVEDADSDKPQSPFLRGRRSKKSGESSGCSGNSQNKLAVPRSAIEKEADYLVSSSSNVTGEIKCDASLSNGHDSDDTKLSHSSKSVTNVTEMPDSSGDAKTIKSEMEISLHNTKKSDLNGLNSGTDEAAHVEVENNDDLCSSSTPENGEVESSNKGKGKGKKVAVIPVSSKADIRRSSRSYAEKLLSATSDSESGDSDDLDDSSEESSSSEELDDDEEGEEESDTCDEDELDELDELDDPEDQAFIASMREEPGSDSGCTAVVAIVRQEKLYVANAGDSRCILSRNGKAIDMSLDHKPEDVIELNRIRKAGGRVTNDGRVNGGLNLSRAIGDHAYKQNKDFPPEEQMISAMPDVEVIRLTPEDEFMVLACDGIWNFMNSQETVNFVRSRLQKDMKLSQIAEEMFDHCLAPNTMGDGTGCDNMTAVIVQFKNSDFYKSVKVAANSDVKTSEETVPLSKAAIPLMEIETGNEHEKAEYYTLPEPLPVNDTSVPDEPESTVADNEPSCSNKRPASPENLTNENVKKMKVDDSLKCSENKVESSNSTN